MPCTVTKEEEEYYEKESNEKEYGVSELSSRITERVACELSRLIEDAGMQCRLSNVAKKWIENHKAKDLAREST